jgi:cysteine desulfurase
MIYLDNNATTLMAPEVLDEMMPFLRGDYGNPSSFHTFGSSVMEQIETARQRIASLLGAKPGEIVFNSGGTEGDNNALFSGTSYDSTRPGLVTTAVEHPAVLETARHLERQGKPLEVIGVDHGGNLDLDALRKKTGRTTGLVSIMAANNETGVLMPLPEAAAIAHGAGALFHTDAVQAVGKVPVDLSVLEADMLSLSGHKLHGPKGVGALFVRKGIPFEPLILGGHQEKGARAGTYNVAGIVGLGKAAELAMLHLRGGADRESALLARLEAGILATCPGAEIAGAASPRLPNTSTVLFTTVESEAVLTLLDLQGIYVSSGSACSTGSKDPSYVLSAMSIGAMQANTAIRFSLSRYTTEAEIDRLLEVLPPLVARLRAISPYSR